MITLLTVAVIASTWANSTAYCESGGMADGTHVRERSVAVVEGTLPLGSKIKIMGKQAGPGGLRYWYVRDHIGSGSELDFWIGKNGVGNCTAAKAWGRRDVHYWVVRRGPKR